jgi:phosphohistidine phosphatase
MQRTLYLIRHADAGDIGLGQKDFDRELTAEGFRKATRLALYLKNSQIKPDYVLVSPSVRTRQTFERINEQIQVAEEDIRWDDDLYEASVRTALRAICSIDVESRIAFLIGHNPSITYLSEYLSGHAIGNMSPGAMVELQFELSSWELVSEKTAQFVRKIEDTDIL